MITKAATPHRWTRNCLRTTDAGPVKRSSNASNWASDAGYPFGGLSLHAHNAVEQSSQGVTPDLLRGRLEALIEGSGRPPRPAGAATPGTAEPHAAEPRAAEAQAAEPPAAEPHAAEPHAAEPQRTRSSSQLTRYLPLSLVVTLVVIEGPALAVALLVPYRGVLWEALAVLLAVAGSLAGASASAWLWKRWLRSRELIFADLMLWSLLRQIRVQRRLIRVREVFEAAQEAGRPVSIELLTQLSDLVQALDPYLHGHSRRVAANARRIARELGLAPGEIAKIESAALLHDVGKIYTPSEILHKPGRLTDHEYAIIRLHAQDGAELVAAAGDPELAAIVRHHHERLDGGGYPDGIAGERIPPGSRIIAVADTFDAITSTRAYRHPRAHKRALDILAAESGKQLDATIVAAFMACYEARRPVARSAFAGAVPTRILAALKASTPSLTTGSLAQTLPAIGAAGVLAAAPALHGGRLANLLGQRANGSTAARSAAGRGGQVTGVGGASDRLVQTFATRDVQAGPRGSASPRSPTPGTRPVANLHPSSSGPSSADTTRLDQSTTGPDPSTADPAGQVVSTLRPGSSSRSTPGEASSGTSGTASSGPSNTAGGSSGKSSGGPAEGSSGGVSGGSSSGATEGSSPTPPVTSTPGTPTTPVEVTSPTTPSTPSTPKVEVSVEVPTLPPVHVSVPSVSALLG
jgi:putative nucleotidyltransferase with HDIG domain